MENVFPILEALQIRAFRSQDWCSVLQYDEGTYTTNWKENCIYLLQGTPEPFDDQASEAFDTVRVALERTGIGVITISEVKYKDGRLDYAVFDCTSGFARQSYVYDHGYSSLPEDIPNELGHVAINADWYYVWEDWN